MKNQLNEPDFIGGQGSLTEKEEVALRKYFTDKKKELSARISKKASSTRKNDPLAL